VDLLEKAQRRKVPQTAAITTLRNREIEKRTTRKAQSRNKQFDQGSLASAAETNIQESVFRSEKYMPKTQRINLTQSNRNMSKLSLEAFNSTMTKDFWSNQQKAIKNGPAILDRLFEKEFGGQQDLSRLEVTSKKGSCSSTQNKIRNLKTSIT
jgi:hypothetical protein